VFLIDFNPLISPQGQHYCEIRDTTTDLMMQHGLSVCLSVCVGHQHELCKNGWTDQYAD